MELWKITAVETLELLKKKELTAEALTRYYLERIEKYNSRLNCIACINSRALEEALELDEHGPDGMPLFGLTVLVKDNINVKGLPITAGSRALAKHC